MKLTSAIEKNGSPTFLDITIVFENNKFVTSVYGKPTLRSDFTNFKSFIPDIYKLVLIETLLHRSIRLCSNYQSIKKNLNILFIQKKTLIPCFLKGS